MLLLHRVCASASGKCLQGTIGQLPLQAHQCLRVQQLEELVIEDLVGGGDDRDVVVQQVQVIITEKFPCRHPQVSVLIHLPVPAAGALLSAVGLYCIPWQLPAALRQPAAAAALLQ